jgi:hypothetical protein
LKAVRDLASSVAKFTAWNGFGYITKDIAVLALITGKMDRLSAVG